MTTRFLRDAVHTMNVEEVLDYIINLNEFDEYGRDGFRVGLHHIMFTEAVRAELGLGMLNEEDVTQMWNEGHVPRVVVEYEFECYDLDFRHLAANVVTHMGW